MGLLVLDQGKVNVQQVELVHPTPLVVRTQRIDEAFDHEEVFIFGILNQLLLPLYFIFLPILRRLSQSDLLHSFHVNVPPQFSNLPDLIQESLRNAFSNRLFVGERLEVGDEHFLEFFKLLYFFPHI